MDASASFQLRWKGQQLGPYTREVIDRKLRSKELSLLHEIQFDGRWISLKTFLEQIRVKEEETRRHQLEEEQRQTDEQRRQGSEKSQGGVARVQPPRGLPQAKLTPPPVSAGRIVCPRCGMANENIARFCARCGGGLSIGAAPAQPHRGSTRGVVYAGFWRRFVAHVIDQLVLNVATGAVIFLFLLVFLPSAKTPEEIAQWFVQGGLWLMLILSLPIALLQWVYYAAMESSDKQGTLGKRAVGIAVTTLDGNRISFGRATGRHFAKFISALTMLIGFLMAAFTDKKQALHDMIAGCLVVRD